MFKNCLRYFYIEKTHKKTVRNDDFVVEVFRATR